MVETSNKFWSFQFGDSLSGGFGSDSSTIFEIQELSSKLGLVPYTIYTLLPNAKDYMGIKFLNKLILRSI
jgi:hypothetical protein